MMNTKILRSICVLLAAIIMIFCFAACGSKTGEMPADTQDNTTETQPAPQDAVTAQTEAPSDDSDPENVPAQDKVLVVYFSATGTTKGVAERIAAVTGGDLYEIVPAEPYSAADLDWNDKTSRTTKEQNDSSIRPAIGSNVVSLDGYSTVFIGYPIWWGEEPRIMDTFVESYNFSGKTMIPFCTSGGSGIGRSGKNLEENAKSGTWLDGKRLQGGVSEDELRSWIDGLK